MINHASKAIYGAQHHREAPQRLGAAVALGAVLDAHAARRSQHARGHAGAERREAGRERALRPSEVVDTIGSMRFHAS